MKGLLPFQILNMMYRDTGNEEQNSFKDVKLKSHSIKQFYLK